MSKNKHTNFYGEGGNHAFRVGIDTVITAGTATSGAVRKHSRMHWAVGLFSNERDLHADDIILAVLPHLFSEVESAAPEKFFVDDFLTDFNIFANIQVCRMFKDAPDNMILPIRWEQHMKGDYSTRILDWQNVPNGTVVKTAMRAHDIFTNAVFQGYAKSLRLPCLSFHIGEKATTPISDGHVLRLADTELQPWIPATTGWIRRVRNFVGLTVQISYKDGCFSEHNWDHTPMSKDAVAYRIGGLAQGWNYPETLERGE